MTDQELVDLAKKEWGNIHNTGVLGFIDGYRRAMKELEAAFEAGRERISHPDWDFVYETFEEYTKSLKETT